MKRTLKMMITMFVFIVGVVMTGITAEAANTIVPLKEGKWTVNSQHKIGGDYYYKITAPATGLVKVYVEEGLVKKNNDVTFFTVYESDRSTTICNMGASKDNNHKSDVCHYLKKGQTIYIRTDGKLGDKHRIAFKMLSANPVYTIGSTYSISLTNATLKKGIYLGFRAPKTGVLSISTVSSGEFYTGLFNNQRKQITYYSELGMYSKAYDACVDMVEYGVKKNQIYYLKLTDDAISYGSQSITLKATIKAAYDPSTAMGNARAVGYNKPVTTALYTKCNSWYKFYLSSPAKVSVYVNTVFFNNAKDKYYLSLYKQGSSKPLYSDTRYGESGWSCAGLDSNDKNVYVRSSVFELKPNYTLSRGMYYLRVATTKYSANGYTKVWYGPCSK